MATFDRPGVRAIIVFISSSSTSDSARVRRPASRAAPAFERLEIQILRQRVDEILVGHRRRDSRVSDARIADQNRFELGAAGVDDAPFLARHRRPIGQRLDAGAAVAAGVIFFDDAEAIEAAQDDVVASVLQPLGMRDHAAAADG